MIQYIWYIMTYTLHTDMTWLIYIGDMTLYMIQYMWYIMTYHISCIIRCIPTWHGMQHVCWNMACDMSHMYILIQYIRHVTCHISYIIYISYNTRYFAYQVMSPMNMSQSCLLCIWVMSPNIYIIWHTIFCTSICNVYVT